LKNLFLAVFICAFSIACYAQALNGYGLKAGWGITNHDWQYTAFSNGKSIWDNNNGFSARVFTDFSIYRYIGLETEIGYSQKGAKYKIPITTNTQPDGTGEFINIDNRLNYLTFSVMGKFKYDMNLVSPYFIIGPQYNYLLNKQISKVFQSVYDNFENNSLGFAAGVGAEINFTAITVLAEYLYARDLTNNYNQSTIEIKNYSHTFLIGIKL